MAKKEIELRIQNGKSDFRIYENWHDYFEGERQVPPVTGPINRGQLWQEFKGIVRYIQTQALDENKPPPTEDEITSNPKLIYD